MDWKLFTVEITKALSWPLAISFIVLFLRGYISELLPRISKLKHKDTEIEFAEVMGSLKEKAEGLESQEANIAEDLKAEEDRLEKLSFVLPRSSILQAWGLIDKEVSELVLESDIPVDDLLLKTSDVIEVVRSIGLDKKSLKTFMQLRKIMKSIIGPSDFSLPKDQVDSYIELTIDLVHTIRTARSNKELQRTSR